MKAVILAAGTGQRLYPVTLERPKCLIDIEGKPILNYQLNALRANGIDRITVVAGHHIDKIRDYTKDRDGVEVIENKQYRMSNILTSFWYALEELAEDEDLVVIAGDVVFEEAILKKLIHSEDTHMTLCVCPKRCGEEEVKVLMDSPNQVQRLGKDLDTGKAYGEFLGVFLARKQALPEIRKITNWMIDHEQGNAYLFDMINSLIDGEKVRVGGCNVEGHLWEEFDYLEDIERVSKKIRENQAIAK